MTKLTATKNMELQEICEDQAEEIKALKAKLELIVEQNTKFSNTLKSYHAEIASLNAKLTLAKTVMSEMTGLKIDTVIHALSEAEKVME